MATSYLITGGAGFLGINLARFLLAKGHTVTSLDIGILGRISTQPAVDQGNEQRADDQGQTVEHRDINSRDGRCGQRVRRSVTSYGHLLSASD